MKQRRRGVGASSLNHGVSRSMHRYIVVSGIPAAGKSTVGAGLAAESGLPLFDKDAFLERLFESGRPKTRAERRSLSIQADRELENAVRGSAGAIVMSWWRHPKSAADSGTPSSWLGALRGSVIEVHCESTPEAAAKRFFDRKRHPGHLDHSWSYDELLAQLTEAAQLGPLHVGPVIKVNTYEPVDFSNLWRACSVASTRGDA
jgi:hypothetical protein